MLSAICFELDQSKIVSSGNGLKQAVKKHCYRKRKRWKMYLYIKLQQHFNSLGYIGVVPGFLPLAWTQPPFQVTTAFLTFNRGYV